jgi:NADH dehydrogenase
VTRSREGAAGRHQVVVVGGGFGGLQAVRALRRAPVDVTLIDRRNFHLFQPLLYQVATGALSAAEIATPLRGILKRQGNARVVLGDVAGFDLDRREVRLGDGDGRAVPYDTLVVAAGAAHAYFGHDRWRADAPGLKTVEDAMEIRRRVLEAFELAELEPDPSCRAALLTFVVVGAGPTGVELAGQIAEIAHDTLRRDFREIDPATATVLLVEGAPRVLPGYDERLSARAARALGRLGVEVASGRTVVGVDAGGVTVRGADGRVRRHAARTVVWAAGVQAAPLAAALGAATGAAVDRAGRVEVGPDLTFPGHPEVLGLGDMVRVQDGDGRVQDLPGVAPVAMQQGRFAARVIRRRLSGRTTGAFAYVDKGSVATIGRLRAVADLRGVRISGALAWCVWMFVHLAYLVGPQNRLLVLVRWTGSLLTRGRGARLIAHERPEGGRVAARPPRPALPAGVGDA